MPDAIEALPALLAFLGALVLIGLSRAYDYSLGALLRVLALALNVEILYTHPFGFLSRVIATLDNDIRNALGKGIEALQYDAAFWFSWTARITEATGEAIADLAESTYGALRVHAKSVTPLLISAALGPVWAAIKQLRAEARAHVQPLPSTVTKVVQVTKSYPVTVQRVAGLPRLVKSAVAAAIAALPSAIPLPHLGRIDREIAALRARLSRAGTALGVGSIVGAVAYALSRLGLSDQQCSNNKRYTKHVCGMDRNLLESLLADTLIVAGTLSLVEFAREMVPVTEAAVEPIRLFWRVR